MNAALLSSKDMGWQTPPEVLDVVRLMAPIGLDPATVDGNPVGADSFFTPAMDGLSRMWSDYAGLVFVNPPYGRELSRWIAKMALEARRGSEIIALIPARPDTRAWQCDVFSASRVCFWAGRIRFVDASTGKRQDAAPFPSAIVYWGDRGERFARIFSGSGRVVRP